MKRIALTTHDKIKNATLDYMCDSFGRFIIFQDLAPTCKHLKGSDNGTVFWNIFLYQKDNYCDGGITGVDILPKL